MILLSEVFTMIKSSWVHGVNSDLRTCIFPKTQNALDLFFFSVILFLPFFFSLHFLTSCLKIQCSVSSVSAYSEEMISPTL